jgi:very-short-patch-repair endonuclease
VTWQVLRERGIERAELRRMRRRGELSAVRRGIDLPAQSDCRRDRLSRALAVSPRAVLSGASAARAHGLDVPARWRDEITIPRQHSPVRGSKELRVVARSVAGFTTDIDGMPATDLRRTVADLLCGADPVAQLWCAAQALVRGLHRTDVHACLAFGQRGVRTARRLLAMADARSESPLESAVALALDAAGLPRPQRQLEIIATTGQVMRVDFAWPGQRVVLEADGVAFHSAAPALLRDRSRQNALMVLGWRTVRCTWADLTVNPPPFIAAVRALLRPSRTTSRP